mgnify:CR=1 FL=1
MDRATIDWLEPTVSETVEVVKGLRSRYEEHQDVKYDDDAIEAAAKLANKHILERFLPDKAIDVIDEAGAADRMKSGLLSTSPSPRDRTRTPMPSSA